MLGLGGALGRSGLADLNNRNVLLTYGAAAPMGGGHKEPAAQIRRILEELKAQNRDNFLGRMNVIDAPVISYEGKISDEAAKAMKGKRFLTGVDTGWGLLDPERAHDVTPTRASWMDRMRGENVRQQDPPFCNSNRMDATTRRATWRLGMRAGFPGCATRTRRLTATSTQGRRMCCPAASCTTWGAHTRWWRRKISARSWTATPTRNFWRST
jgi:hypothetical protein